MSESSSAKKEPVKPVLDLAEEHLKLAQVQKEILSGEIDNLKLFVEEHAFYSEKIDKMGYSNFKTMYAQINGHKLRVHQMSSILPSYDYLNLRPKLLVGFLDEIPIPEENAAELFVRCFSPSSEKYEENRKNIEKSHFMQDGEDPWKYFDDVASKPNMGKDSAKNN